MFASLAAHAAQFAFLVFFENPREFLRVRFLLSLGFFLSKISAILDIERFYGQRKPLAQRVPIRRASLPTSSSTSTLPQVTQSQLPTSARARAFSDPPSTPSATEGSTASESEGETETELVLHRHSNGSAVPKLEVPPAVTPPLQIDRQRSSSPMSHHDVRNKYFRRDTILLFHLDIFRCVAFS